MHMTALRHGVVAVDRPAMDHHLMNKRVFA